MSNAMIQKALFATQIICCHCDEVFHLLESNMYDSQAGKVSCEKCALAPCAKCTYSGDALSPVLYNNDITIRSPREEQQLHLRICCTCGSPEDIDVKKLYRNGAILSTGGKPSVHDVAGFSVQFRKHKCAACDHKCCRTCACFLEAEDVAARGFLNAEAGKKRRKSVSSLASLRSIGSVICKVANATGSAIAAFAGGKVGETTVSESRSVTSVIDGPVFEVDQDLSNLVPEFELGTSAAR